MTDAVDHFALSIYLQSDEAHISPAETAHDRCSLVRRAHLWFDLLDSLLFCRSHFDPPFQVTYVYLFTLYQPKLLLLMVNLGVKPPLLELEILVAFFDFPIEVV